MSAHGYDANSVNVAVTKAMTGQTTANPRYGVIGFLIGANLNSTADQPFTMASGFSTYQPTLFVCTNRSATPTLAAGGIYTSSSKGGTAIVAAGTTYTAMSAANVVFNPTIAVTTTQTANPLYLALTTANGSACTCDIYIYGNILK